MKTQSRFTKAEVARATRAAIEAGAGAVEIRPDGTIRIELEKVEKPKPTVERTREIVL